MNTSAEPKLRLFWKDNRLRISSSGPLPGGEIEVHYLEAFCRPGSTDRKWNETVIPHETELVSARDDGSKLVLLSRVADGVEVSHIITSADDEVDFRLEIRNPTDVESEVHWAQPCIRVGKFTGLSDHPDPYEFIKRCFIFLDGKPVRMPMEDWAAEAMYTPGQEWCPHNVPRTDVGPRPVSPLVPSNGLIGCFSGDESMVLATAWEPYQMLFQGIIQCIHADFRIGGVSPHETKEARGTIYLVSNDMEALVERYESDFPEHGGGKPS